MGLLVDGVWTDQWYDTKSTGGKFVRQDSRFRNWVTADGSQGPTGEDGFEAEAGRYRLYVSLACPWAHRTLIFRKLKKLEDAIAVSIVDPLMADEGWTFPAADPVTGATRLWEIYTRADPTYTGRVTVPVLWDNKRQTIVNNESADIIRMFNNAFDHIGDGIGDPTVDFYPSDMREAIDAINKTVYSAVNNGVYKTGFATTQVAYESAFSALFEALDDIETRLSRQRYLAGDRLSEADWRLFTTLVRFDAVYVGHFKCNLRRINDYPNLSHYLRELYQMPGIAETVDMDHIKRHYYASHTTVNPTGIVPLGPELDFLHPHNRTRLAA